jgi:hypothetical protein
MRQKTPPAQEQWKAMEKQYESNGKQAEIRGLVNVRLCAEGQEAALRARRRRALPSSVWVPPRGQAGRCEAHLDGSL